MGSSGVNGCFEVLAADTSSAARRGRLRTRRGVIETPIFMPVGTQGTVKAVSPRELHELRAQIILGNTYHLFVRPGLDVIRRLGGLHKFMGWDGPILTDSGGFQVFSLAKLRKITPEGVHFQNHLDGTPCFIGPETSMEIQHTLGSDIVMAFDECPPHPCTHEEAARSLQLTLGWEQRSLDWWAARHDEEARPLLFGIVQGSVYQDLRQQCAGALVDMDLPGYAIGGLAVGEPREEMIDVIRSTTPHLPAHKPRYLMGVGLPHDLVEAVGHGVDMFDCVVPTRNARNGTAFTRSGRLRLKNAQHAEDNAPIEEGCACKTCTNYSRAYLRHLFQTGEFLGLHLATFHNIFFFQQFMREARQAIIDGHFAQWQRDFLAGYRDR